MAMVGVAGVNHSQTVPRHLVHRQSVHEVLLTDATVVKPGSYLVGVQWPRTHVVTGLRPVGTLDEVLVLEAIRQIGLYLTHRYYDVPVSTRFIARELGTRWTADRPSFGQSPINAVGLVDVTEGRPASARGGLRLQLTFDVAGSAVATGIGDLRCLAPEVYARIRGEMVADSSTLSRPPAGVEPGLVGRVDPFQVLIRDVHRLGAHRAEAVMRIDPRHTCFFDHPQEHLPANLLAEATRQMALLAAGAPMSYAAALHLSFVRFTALDKPVTLRAHHSTDSVDVSVEQAGVVTARGQVKLAHGA